MSRKCKHCKLVELKPAGKCDNIIEKKGFCSIDHAAKYGLEKARIAQDKKAKAQHRADLKRVRRNPRREALEVAQHLGRISAANDNGYCTCVTCGKVGKYKGDGFDGGHFIAKSKSSYWMLDPRNIHPQCKACNGDGMKFHGKEVDYTLWMIDTYGRDFVEHMKEVKGTVVKRNSVDYDDYIESAKKEIIAHEVRVGMRK